MASVAPAANGKDKPETKLKIDMATTNTLIYKKKKYKRPEGSSISLEVSAEQLSCSFIVQEHIAPSPQEIKPLNRVKSSKRKKNQALYKTMNGIPDFCV